MCMVFRCVPVLDSVVNWDMLGSPSTITLALPFKYFMCTSYCASLSNSHGLEAAVPFFQIPVSCS